MPLIAHLILLFPWLLALTVILYRPPLYWQKRPILNSLLLASLVMASRCFLSIPGMNDWLISSVGLERLNLLTKPEFAALTPLAAIGKMIMERPPTPPALILIPYGLVLYYSFFRVVLKIAETRNHLREPFQPEQIGNHGDEMFFIPPPINL